MIKGLYIHIPFCSHICLYCDFPKLVASESLRKEYMNALKKELVFHKDKLKDLETVYIGGGTPSFIKGALLDDFLDELEQVLPLDNILEFTIEANPNDIDDVLIASMKTHHINRISIGVQSFQDTLLKKIGRIHSDGDILDAIHKLIDQGIENISIDLMVGLPDESLEDVALDLKKAVQLPIKHLSVYSLIVEERTELHHLLKLGKIHLPEESLEEEMTFLVHNILKNSKFKQYEISNYCVEGNASLHNLKYWNLEEYLGIGLKAASQMDGRRFVNHQSIRHYIEAVNQTSSGIEMEEPFNPPQETLMLGLRKTEGISLSDFERKFETSVFEAFPELRKHLLNGLLVQDKDVLRFSEEGMKLSNQVLIDLF